MSLPVCNRCQKIYSESIVPEKCLNCGGEIKSLETRTPVQETNLPPTFGSSQASVATSQNNAYGNFGATIAGIIFIAILLFIGWQLLSWLFSLDWSNDGEPIRFRIPYRRR